MSNPAPDEPPRTPDRRRFQFGLGTLLLVVVPVSIMAGAWAGMVNHGEAPARRGLAMVTAVAAPIALVIVMSLVRSLIRPRNPSPRRRQQDR